jgi:triosephosphate isomerase (TIM)
MRKPIIAGNWKMHKTAGETRQLIAELRQGPVPAAVEAVVCPPFTSLGAAVEAAGTALGVGAQDLFWKDSGAYTAQVAPPMLTDLGVRYVIIGHSERRGRFGVPEEGFTPDVLSVFGETDATVNLKLQAALRHGLTPIVCCGETLDERRADRTDEVVAGQIERGLAGIAGDEARVVIAYEPVWAIGTGETCAAKEADRVCGVIRSTLERLFGRAAGESIRIQYGGSVKPDNARDLLGRPNIDGALVGGASLKAGDFLAILNAA